MQLVTITVNKQLNKNQEVTFLPLLMNVACFWGYLKRIAPPVPHTPFYTLCYCHYPPPHFSKVFLYNYARTCEEIGLW